MTVSVLRDFTHSGIRMDIDDLKGSHSSCQCFQQSGGSQSNNFVDECWEGIPSSQRSLSIPNHWVSSEIVEQLTTSASMKANLGEESY